MGRAKTRFTPDEQYTLMTLWSIARSPLMIGADLTKLDDFTHSLLTNPEVLNVNQRSENGRQLYKRGDFCVWIANVPGSKDKYLAIFNTGNSEATHTVSLSEVGFPKAKIRDLWARSDLGVFTKQISSTIKSHGAALYRVSSVN
jgi:hypothetical protein